MNNKQLKVEMEKELDTLETPNVSSSVMIEYDERVYARKNQAKKHGLFLKFGCAFASLVIVGGTIYAISHNGSSNPGTTPVLTSNKEVFAFESFSSLTFVSNQQITRQMMRRKNADMTLNMQNQIRQEVSKILPLLESTLLVEDGIKIETDENKKEGYAYCDKVTITLENQEEIYYLYYNKTEETEVDESEKEVKTFYEGEMVFDTETYRFEMKGEIEEEDNEVEKESTFTLYTGVGKESAIITSREIENGEEEFSYKVKENGEDVFEVSIEIEEKKGKIETKVEYENEAKDIEYEYVFSKEQDEIGEYYLLKGQTKEETNHSIRIRKTTNGNYEMTFYDEKNESPLTE